MTIAAIAPVALRAVAPPARPAPAVEDFASMVREAAASAVSAGYRAEAVGLDAVAGRADLNDLVAAVTQAELALQSVAAIRDRAVAAYQDILRMPI